MKIQFPMLLRRLASRYKLKSNQDLSMAHEAERYRSEFKNAGANSTNSWIAKSAKISGWLFPGEHELLWQLAMENRCGDILEVGSWMGKSACILAGACIERGDNSKVICVDPFDLRGTEWQTAFHKLITGNAQTTFEQFLLNAKTYGFHGHTVPVAAISEVALKLLKGPFRVVFLDGCHDYQTVKMEVELLSPLMQAGAALAMHDATDDFPGVKQFARELESHPDWSRENGAGSIAVFRKK